MSHTHAHGVCTNPRVLQDSVNIDGRFTAHRTLIVRKLKGLEDFIPFTSVHWHMLDQGPLHPTSFQNRGRELPPDNQATRMALRDARRETAG